MVTLTWNFFLTKYFHTKIYSIVRHIQVPSMQWCVCTVVVMERLKFGRMLYSAVTCISPTWNVNVTLQFTRYKWSSYVHVVLLIKLPQ